MQALATELKRRFPGQRVPLLTALLNDKSPDRCLEPLQGLISQIFTTSVASPRSTSAADLSAAIRHSWPTTPTLATGHTLEDLENLPLAPHLPLIIAGSTYLAGEILKELESFPIEP
jgi:folylpolyglutamate synthase/dihydropteroate synthase